MTTDNFFKKIDYKEEQRNGVVAAGGSWIK